MTESNRLQLCVVRETTPGTTPLTPRMRKARITGESLSFTPEYVDPDELRDDRMMGDPIKVMQASQGGINFEVSYPVDNSPLSEIYRSGFRSAWVNTPQFDNDGTADSVITDVSTVAGFTYVVTSGGTAVKVGHLVRATGFTNAGNNQIFRSSASTGTTITAPSVVSEPAPPGTARLKVVGFQGASGDITATAGGLGSTTLDFTTLGLVPGQWLKIGGIAAGDRFATGVLNDWVRISGTITATAIPLDNKPAGWTTDAGAGKTIKVWFGDQIRNGVLESALTIERGFLGQTVPTYIVNTGMQVNTLEHTINSKAKVTGSANFMGMGGLPSLSPLDASPDPATTGQVMAANANVGRIAEAGARLTDPNWARQLTFTINNNSRTLEAADSDSPVGVNDGECQVSGRLSTYFGSNSILAKLYSGQVTALNARIAKNGQGIIWQFPRITLRTGAPNAAGKNQDVMLEPDWQASIDTDLTQSHVLLDRIEYFEA